jgi:hypothetical protein
MSDKDTYPTAMFSHIFSPSHYQHKVFASDAQLVLLQLCAGVLLSW